VSQQIVEQLRERLSTLSPSVLEIADDSSLHAGHAGAREGGHYRVTIVSSQFAKLNTLARHRLVYDAVGNLMQHGIHALVIDARITDEV